MIEGLKDGKKAVGIKQTMKEIEKGTAKVVFVARDADERVVGKVVDLCKAEGVQLEYVDTMKLLGKACNIDVGAAVACAIS